MHFGFWSSKEYCIILVKALMLVSQGGNILSLCIYGSFRHIPARASFANSPIAGLR